MMESNDCESYELVPVDNNVQTFILNNGLIDPKDNIVLNSTHGYRILSFKEDDGDSWSLQIPEESVEEDCPPNTTVGLPVIEEENSCDNLPAIGHLEEFEITTAEDGTPLPSTVNAIMADGSHQRITLFPEIAGGNITYMVHFENDDVAPEPPPPEISISTSSVLDKIDQLISLNDDLLSKSRSFSSKSVPISDKSKEIRKPLKPKLGRSALHYPVKEALTLAPSSILLSMKRQGESLLKPIAPNVSNGLTKHLKPQRRGISLLKPKIKPQEEKEQSKILIKATPELFPAVNEENDHPPGSTENPIQLVKSGNTYHSKAPLSELQLKQLTAALSRHKIDGSMYDPENNVKIGYRDVPKNIEPLDTLLDEHAPSERSTRPSKRGRRRIEKAPKRLEVVELESSSEKVDASKIVTIDDDDQPKNEEVPSPVKIPRTRSGRVTRPPRHIVRDYKKLDTDEPGKKDPEIKYQDFQTPPADIAAPVAPVNTQFESLDLNQRMKKRNFKSHFRCPTCKKVYLSNFRMILHLRKFPDHCTPEQYAEVCRRSSCTTSNPRDSKKFKKFLTMAEKNVRTEAFSLWDYLLLHIKAVKKQSGLNEVEVLLKELSCLLEKIRKIAEVVMVPAFSREEEINYIELDKHDLGYVLGLPLGLYKIEEERLHLLRLNEKPAAPPSPPQPDQLSTKFEPNLSTKLLDCSNDSIDLDCSSKDVEPEEEKKVPDWDGTRKVEDSNSEFLSEFLQSLPEENPPPSQTAVATETLNIWKGDEAVDHATSQPIWKERNTAHDLGAPSQIWRRAKSVDAADDLHLWKDGDGTSWKNGEPRAANNFWKVGNGNANELWKPADSSSNLPAETNSNETQSAEPPWKETEKSVTNEGVWDVSSGEKEGKKDWLRLWKEEPGGPAVRTSRLTSTPETHASALFSPPLRRNSVSSFAPSQQEELLGLDLHELFNDLLPEQVKPQRPKPSSIESIINEALFTGNEPPPSHSSLPPTLNMPDSLDEVANLDFLNH